VDRPNRQARRRSGKSDPQDAIEAARAALSGRACGREGAGPVMPATKTALQILGRRVLALDEEKARIDVLLTGLVTQTAPQLLAT
jgi:hypothetical protein